MTTRTPEWWKRELEDWLGPFLDRLPRKGQRRWAVAYIAGLLLPGGRKSVEPLAERVAPGEVQQLHHFVAASPWDTAPLEDGLARWADRLLGGPDATLVVDDLFLAKQGGHSVGVARQACDEAGRQANGQALVALTLCRGEAAVPVGLRLHLPEAWCADAARRREAGVPDGLGYRPRWRIALDELDARIAAGLRAGRVVAPAAYGGCAGFRRGLAERGLACALEAPPPAAAPALDGAPAALDHTTIVWRGSPPAPHVVRLGALPLEGDGAGWLVHAEHVGGGRGGWLVDRAPGRPEAVAAEALQALWLAREALRRLRGEVGLDHFEGRGWRGLHHHLLLCQLAAAFLHHLRAGRPRQGRGRGAVRRPATPDLSTLNEGSPERLGEKSPPGPVG